MRNMRKRRRMWDRDTKAKKKKKKNNSRHNEKGRGVERQRLGEGKEI